ncbi:MAG: hypothetical protein KBT36_14975 [Kurthia sp.]|nr:hypothetical protein [Candidatus Kurthia equi]
MWNPFIDPEKVITNDVIIGDDFTNMILCGHNGGGKSTYLKALIIAMLLSQTFGIAPAKEMTMTLFKYIRIMSTINEEFNDSDSLFKSEIKRLRDYINLCKFVKDNEFICTVFDEPLHGTDSTSAVVLLKSIFKYLSSNKKLLQVISTHYRDIISLEDYKKERFRNYLVEVKFLDDDNFEYTYKIIPGNPKRSIALNIASKEGLDKDVLLLAKKEQSSYHSRYECSTDHLSTQVLRT